MVGLSGVGWFNLAGALFTGVFLTGVFFATGAESSDAGGPRTVRTSFSSAGLTAFLGGGLVALVAVDLGPPAALAGVDCAPLTTGFLETAGVGVFSVVVLSAVGFLGVVLTAFVAVGSALETFFTAPGGFVGVAFVSADLVDGFLATGLATGVGALAVAFGFSWRGFGLTVAFEGVDCGLLTLDIFVGYFERYDSI